MEDLSEAYEKYLKFWPSLKRTMNDDRPKTFKSFGYNYKFAKNSRMAYEAELVRGELKPLSYYSLICFDEFLCILHTKEEMHDAFINGFAFDPNPRTQEKATHLSPPQNSI